MFTTSWDKATGEKHYNGKEVDDFFEKERERKEQARRKLEADDRKYKYGKAFVRVYSELVEVIQPKLRLADAGIVYKLMCNIFLNRNGVIEKKKGKPFSQTDMQHLLKMGERGTSKALQRLVDLNILSIEKNETDERKNVYILNENMICMGKGSKGGSFTKVKKIRAKSLLEILTNSEAGLIFKLLPFIHYKTLTLTSNPTEEDVSKLIILNGVELAEKLGIDKDTFKRHVKSLCKKHVIMRYDIGEIRNGLFFNPHLVDRGYEAYKNDEYNYKNMLINLFDFFEK